MRILKVFDFSWASFLGLVYCYTVLLKFKILTYKILARLDRKKWLKILEARLGRTTFCG